MALREQALLQVLLRRPEPRFGLAVGLVVAVVLHLLAVPGASLLPGEPRRVQASPSSWGGLGARSIAQQLVTKGSVSHAMIGVGLDAVRSSSGAQVTGALVRSVMPAGPAARAGLRVGDVITAAADQAVRDPAQLTQLVERNGVGRSMELTVQRQGQTLRLQVTPVELSSLMGSR